MSAAAVDVTGLTKTYPDGRSRGRNTGGHRALDGVDLRVEPGETVALVGSNGAGKSTLLRCLVRLHEPTDGTVHLHGIDVGNANRRQLRRIRTDVGFVFQRYPLVKRLSAFHNVLHGAMGRQGSRCVSPLTAPDDTRRDAMDCLDRVGLADLATQRAGTMSGGQQQRVAIARLLMQDPTLILADEPVASLDPVAGVEVMELLTDIAAERGLTVIAALHQLDYALRFTQRIVGLQHGRLTLDQPSATCDAGQLNEIYGAAPPAHAHTTVAEHEHTRTAAATA
ncbi:MAG: phosphonate ABC transporter ATP-binding protein [Actinomycetota bacterium]|nr:phosphonate ABC transporter ATP-binding protein [Actinomycetota bacterium]